MADPSDLYDVRRVLSERRDELLSRFEAHGIGIGRGDSGYVIVIYLDSPEDRPADAPDVEGVPLKFEVTGPFSTL